MVLARAALDDERLEAQRMLKKAEADRAALAAQREKVLDTEAEKLRDALRRAREDVRQARRLLKKEPDAPAIDDVKRRIEEAAKVAATRPDAPTPADHGPPVDPRTLTVGARVWVPRLRTVAEVVEAPQRGKVRVGAGALRLFVDVSELRAPGASSEAKERKERPVVDVTGAAPLEPKVSPMTIDNTLDVRGMRVDDAVPMAESFLDRMYGANEGVAYILHGVGTGALRDAIRELLRSDASYVRSFRGGSREEGGDRLTVVSLK
jgi:DNA mismatch repair protein MutS2